VVAWSAYGALPATFNGRWFHPVQAQRAGKAPCWAIEKGARKVAFAIGTGSAAGKPAARNPRASVSPLSNANTSDHQSTPGRGHGKEAGEAGEGLQDAPYQMLRDGFSKHGEDALVLQMLLHDRVVRAIDEPAVGDGEREMEASVRPGGGSFGMEAGGRGAFVEIGLPYDGKLDGSVYAVLGAALLLHLCMLACCLATAQHHA